MIQVGKPVIGKELIGREKEIKEIIQYLKMGQSVVIIAPRRFGKTSLVLEVLRKLKAKKSYTGFVDIFANATINQLTQSIIEEVLENNGLKKGYQKTKGSIIAMLKNLKLKAVIEDFEFLLGIHDPGTDEWTSFEESIDFIDGFAAKADKKIIFAFDEYGDTLKYDGSQEIIKMMRSKIQSQSAATYIFSGSYESVMETLFVDSKSPFYRLARIINIGYLGFEDLKQYMVDKLKAFKIKPNELLIEDTIDFLKGHPYYCQLALQQMYLYQVTEKKAPSFAVLVDILVQTDRNYLEKVWEDLSGNREVIFILKHLSGQPTGIYKMASKRKINASRTLKKLEGQGIIYKENDGYYFYDPVFEYWIAHTINA
jgi:AAA+ ATPase superfamily predicted ATPase